MSSQLRVKKSAREGPMRCILGSVHPPKLSHAVGHLLLLHKEGSTTTFPIGSLSPPVLLVRGLGVQLQTLYGNGALKTEFIQISSVKDVILQEAVYGFRIITYLAIEVEADDTPASSEVSLRTAKDSRLLLPFETLEVSTPQLVEVYFALRDLVPQIADDSSTDFTDSTSSDEEWSSYEDEE
ncbi:hypothetical protein FOL47_009093 [Perkinsus chesapeaki]|uniref:Phosphatidylinositol N-acetylglucosaminyltransferase subunit H conserved domain-containing protein n=1 Tax=Perkinsus chesapeaki TaxID=330153 RepID=A0A7J6LAI5_PERCH|nr:hypothetical protein FOL47_009093 [Perkinsus chesapeaki]